MDHKTKLIVLIVTDLVLLFSWLEFLDQKQMMPAASKDFGTTCFGAWIISFFSTLKSDFFQSKPIKKRIVNHLKQVFVFSSSLIFYLIFFGSEPVENYPVLHFAVGVTALGLPRIGIQKFVINQPEYKNHILFVGDGSISRAVRSLIQNSGTGEVVGFVDDRPETINQPDHLGRIDDLKSILQKKPFHQIIIAPSLSKDQSIQKVISFSEQHGIRTSMVLDEPILSTKNYELRDIGGLPIADLREVPLDHYMAKFWKRGFDVCFSLIVIILLTPLFLIIALAVKLESSGPILYRATRIGRNGNQIKVLKFRSMYQSLDASQEKISAQKNDPRITKVGRFLRRYSLDELPQFFNVLEGTMSVVGPRPHRTDLDEKFREEFSSYPVRRFIKPGITGWAQINGWRGLTDTRRDYKARALHDLWYLEHWSIGLDIMIILLTVFGKKSNQNVF